MVPYANQPHIMVLIKTIPVAFAAFLVLPVGAFAFYSPLPLTHHVNRRVNDNYLPKSFVRLSLSSPDEYDPYGEENFVEEQYQPPVTQQPETLDPLVASLTRIDEPPSQYTRTTNVPLLGEIPADGNLALLVPAAAIAILGFLFSIVVAFNARDAIVEEFSQVQVELPKMEYTPTVVEEGVCRGLCSSQESDLEGLRGFMQGLSK